MKSSESLFFIAILPPLSIQEKVTQIKQYFSQQYQSCQALKSPPHITLKPPFKPSTADVNVIKEQLVSFAIKYSAFPVILSGFNAFPPRVIYIDVEKTPELLQLHQNLNDYLKSVLMDVKDESKQRSFSPHMTVAFRDLTKKNFHAAWTQFQNQTIHFEFIANHLTLLRHTGRCWQIEQEFPFKVQL